MHDRHDKPNFLVYLAYLGVFAVALNTVFLVLPNDQMKWYLMGFLVVAVMTGVVLNPKHYVTIGLVLDLAGLITFGYYAWVISKDPSTFGTFFGEMLSVMLVLRTFKLFRNHDFLLPLIISLTLIVFAAIPSFSAEFVYNLLAFLVFLGIALFLGSIDEFARLPRQYTNRSQWSYTYDFLEEYKPIPLSHKKPVQLLSFTKPALKAAIPAVFFSFLISSGTYFTVDHTMAAYGDDSFLQAFGGGGIEADSGRQADLLTGNRMGNAAQHYVGFDTEFNIAGGRIEENSTSTEIVMEVESNLPSYWRGKAFDVYTGRGWKQSENIKSASWKLDPPVGQHSLYHADIKQPEIVAAGITPDPDIASDEIRQIFYLSKNLPGIVFTAYQPLELSMPIPAVKIDDTFTLLAPTSADSMVAGSKYSVVSKKHIAQSEILKAHDYKLDELKESEPDFVSRYTELPERGQTSGDDLSFDFSRVRAKAFEITAGDKTVYGKLESLMNWLETNYTYSLNPPAAVPGEKDAVDYFLFDWEHKRGHCEYFSSSLAVLCRSIGIPARVVTGYAPGIYNLIKNRYVVQERHAHAWVEIFWPDLGWVEFDATPHTWYQGIGDTVSGTWVTFHNAMQELYVYNPRGYFTNKVFPAMARLWGQAGYFMNQRELDLFDTLNPLVLWVKKSTGIADLLLAAAIGCLLAIFALRRRHDFAQIQKDVKTSGTRCFRKIGRQLTKRGVPPEVLATEEDYAEEAVKMSASWGIAVRQLVNIYQDVRYSGRKTGLSDLANIKRACRVASRAPRM
jgi:hypothetical protein